MPHAPTTDRQGTRNGDDGCPPWCDPERCDRRQGGAHIASTPPLKPSIDDVEIRVDRALWPAEPRFAPDPAVLLDLRSTAFMNEKVRGFLTPADAREVARRLIEAANTACQPWCTEHLTGPDACSTDAVEVPGSGGISMWASQSPADPAAVVSVDGHDAEGLPFELLLTPEQTRALGTSLLQLEAVTDRG